ncbi:MAG: O-antigen ligase family protein [Gaiellaceae bacterium]
MPGAGAWVPAAVLPARRTSRLLDALLFATLFTITFTKVRWPVAAGDIALAEISASLFVLAFALARLRSRELRFPRTVGVLAAFFVAFTLVYLTAFFNLDTSAERELFTEGVAEFTIHFAFLATAVAYVAGRSEGFYWRTLAWFVAGMAANALYGLVQLAAAERGTYLDELVLTPLGSYHGFAIDVFGQEGGEAIYRTNALTWTPNHLGIILAAALLVGLPVYLRLERGHALRAPLAAALVLSLLAELTTLSRSGALAVFVGLAVLAVPYRRFLLSPRLLGLFAAVVGVAALVVVQRADFFENVFRARATFRVEPRTEIWSQLPEALAAHPLFGIGLNTFTAYYEFASGIEGMGPHSYYVAVLSESGLVGAALTAVYLVYLFRRLHALRELGQRLARAGDVMAARVHPLAWGFTAALVGTLAANVFLMTITMFYFFGLALLALAAPIVFSRSELAARHGRYPRASRRSRSTVSS